MLRILRRRKMKSSVEQFEGEWLPYSVLAKLGSAVAESKMQEQDRVWLDVYRFFFDKIDETSIREKLSNIIKSSDISDSWLIGLSYLTYAYLSKELGIDQDAVSNSLAWVKDKKFFLEDKQGDIRIIRPDLGFALGLYDSILVGTTRSDIFSKIPDNEREEKLFKIYYHLAIKLKHKKNHQEYLLPMEIGDLARSIIYDVNNNLIDRLLAAALHQPSAEEIRNLSKELQGRLIPSSMYDNNYRSRHNLFESMESDSESIFSLEPSDIFKTIIALRLLDLDRIVYLDKSLKEKVDKLITTKNAKIISRWKYGFYVILSLVAFPSAVFYLLLNPITDEQAKSLWNIITVLSVILSLVVLLDIAERIKSKLKGN